MAKQVLYQVQDTMRRKHYVLIYIEPHDQADAEDAVDEAMERFTGDKHTYPTFQDALDDWAGEFDAIEACEHGVALEDGDCEMCAEEHQWDGYFDNYYDR